MTKPLTGTLPRTTPHETRHPTRNIATSDNPLDKSPSEEDATQEHPPRCNPSRDTPCRHNQPLRQNRYLLGGQNIHLAPGLLIHAYDRPHYMDHHLLSSSTRSSRTSPDTPSLRQTPSGHITPPDNTSNNNPPSGHARHRDIHRITAPRQSLRTALKQTPFRCTPRGTTSLDKLPLRYTPPGQVPSYPLRHNPLRDTAPRNTGRHAPRTSLDKPPPDTPPGQPPNHTPRTQGHPPPRQTPTRHAPGQPPSTTPSTPPRTRPRPSQKRPQDTP
nr:extensin-like [Penaeus vannamei]